MSEQLIKKSLGFLKKPENSVIFSYLNHKLTITDYEKIILTTHIVSEDNKNYSLNFEMFNSQTSSMITVATGTKKDIEAHLDKIVSSLKPKKSFSCKSFSLGVLTVLILSSVFCMGKYVCHPPTTHNQPYPMFSQMPTLMPNANMLASTKGMGDLSTQNQILLKKLASGNDDSKQNIKKIDNVTDNNTPILQGDELATRLKEIQNILHKRTPQSDEKIKELTNGLPDYMKTRILQFFKEDQNSVSVPTSVPTDTGVKIKSEDGKNEVSPEVVKELNSYKKSDHYGINDVPQGDVHVVLPPPGGGENINNSKDFEDFGIKMNHNVLGE